MLVAGAPASLRGRNLNDKLNIAFIGSGGRANTNLRELTMLAGQKPPDGPPDPHAGPHPDENVTVLCDVSQPALDAASAKYPKAKTYTDLRKIFDSPNDFDAVVVSTAECTHAVATYLALTHGKHVYCEKPLTYNIWEARLIRETAAKYPKLSTQMGNQGHALPIRRVIKEILNTGVIGPVREVHVWVDRAWGLQDAASAEKFDKAHGFYKGVQIVERFKEEMPIPAGNNFDLWIGPAPARPFHETYFPGPRWYRWWDFGNGTMSDLGSHDNDVPYTVLDIKQPLSIEATSPNGKPHPELAPATMTAVYEFRRVSVGRAAREAGLASGESKPPGWVPEWGNRSAVVHRRQGHAARQRQAAARGEVQGLQDAGADAAALAGALGRVGQLREGEWPCPRLELPYSGWTTEANHLGNVAYRTGKKIEWDYKKMRAEERAGGGPLHQARIPQGLGRHPEDVGSAYVHDSTRFLHADRAGVGRAAGAAVQGRRRRGAGRRRCRRKEKVNPIPVRIGMTDWNLGQRGDISKVALAREIGLDGIQVSVQYPTDGKTPTLRDPKTQAAFKRAALENGIQICSLAIGSPGKSRLPLHKSPAAAILLTEAVEIAHNIGTNNILLPILGDSHIDMANQAEVDTFVATMKEVARYAERYGVVVGLEDWISAEDNNKLLDAIGSDYIAVYYDPQQRRAPRAWA